MRWSQPSRRLVVWNRLMQRGLQQPVLSLMLSIANRRMRPCGVSIGLPWKP